jgi:hypothetical protein
MSIQTRIKTIEQTTKINHKPKLYGTPLEGCWGDELEAIWLKKAQEAGHDLARPILGGRSKKNDM